MQSCKSNRATDITVVNDTSNSNYVQIATGQVVTYGEDGEILEGLKPKDSLYGQDANYLKGKKCLISKMVTE